MTIALGFAGNEGIVLAADSQVTVSGYIKGRKGKVKTIIYPSGTVTCFAGSGDTDYIDTAIEKAILNLGTQTTLREVVELIEKNLLTFFDEHLARWAYFPENERPTVELLIGITTTVGAFGLFHYVGTSFHRVDHKAIGAGLLLANNLISQYEAKISSATVEQMSVLAIYILARVKAQVDTCGGFTDLVALRKNGDFALTESTKIEKLEGKLEALEQRTADTFTKKLLGNTFQLTWLRETAKKLAGLLPKESHAKM